MVNDERTDLYEIEDTETEEYRDRLQRLQADFINYKRRVEREREAQARSASEDLIMRLLPVLDDFARALSNVPEHLADSDWIEGVKLVERNLNSILADEGLSQIHPEGEEFNPQEHEAVLTEEGSEDEQGKIKSVIRDGYKLHEKLLRPAQVSVIKGMKANPKSVAGQKVPVQIGGNRRWEHSRVAPSVRGIFS